MPQPSKRNAPPIKPSILPLAVLAIGSAAAVTAQDTRQLGAHEHGHSTLNIAFDGGTIALELDAPGADIVGFEHGAASAEDRARIDAAIAVLSTPLSLFEMPQAAACTVTQAQVGLVGGGDHHEEHADEHAHDEHAEDEHEEHAHAEHHAEGDAGHTEFQARWQLDCADPGAIDRIGFAFFKAFPNAEEVDVQLITETGARGFEVGRDDPILDLSGQI